jgi:hypothetical protein
MSYINQNWCGSLEARSVYCADLISASYTDVPSAFTIQLSGDGIDQVFGNTYSMGACTELGPIIFANDTGIGQHFDADIRVLVAGVLTVERNGLSDTCGKV